MLNEILIIFAFTGIAFVPIMLIFLTCGADRKHQFGGAFAVLLIWIIFTLGIFFQTEAIEEIWNNGYCECGTHWELKGVSENKCHKTKFYTCPNCYTEIEIHN